jgi:catechol 2,3-dioxygenase-like lactoylglutathione lyase family enzyme
MTIAEGPMIQVAWVVEDLDATEELLGGQFGVRGWTRIPAVHFDPDTTTYRDAPGDFVVDISLAYSGDLQLELIRPVSGESIYTEFLDGPGPGLHHVCFEVDEMEAACRRAADAGIAVVQRGTMAGGLMDFAYLDGAAAGAPYVELARIGDELRAFFLSIKEG